MHSETQLSDQPESQPAIFPKPIVRTHSAAFSRFTVRVDADLLSVLSRFQRRGNYISQDAALTALLNRRLQAVQQQLDEAAGRDGAGADFTPCKTAVATWKNVSFTAVQYHLYQTLIALDPADKVASAGGRVFCAANVEIAQASASLTSQMVREHVDTLQRKGVLTRSFFRHVEAPDGRGSREQYVYIIHADPADVVVL